MQNSCEPSAPGLRSRTLDWLWILVAIVPLQMIYYYHFQLGSSATGLVQSDMPQYTANGREVFERGNGFSYPNPYDNDPAAPPIYFHWLLWLLGFGVVKLGLDPGYLTMGFGIVLSPLLGWLTWRVVDEMLTGRAYRRLLFLMSMWAGGIICLAAIYFNVTHGQWWRQNLLEYDPGWNHNWGRNLIYSTEVVYHILSAACWLAIFRRQWAWATVAGFLLATTHPFSGLQLIGALCTWWLLRIIWVRDRASWTQGILCALIAAGFLGYNLVFLNHFPQHKAIHDKLTLPHLLTNRDILVAYVPVALLALVRLAIDFRRLTHRDVFLLVMFGVSFALATHDRFLPIKPIEPKHFTRGYIWMPLFLLSLPLLQRVLVGLEKWVGRLAGSGHPDPATSEGSLVARWVVCAALSPVALVACLDNLCFNFLLFGDTFERRMHAGCYLAPSARDALAWIERHHLDGILLCPGEGTKWNTRHRMTSYLATSYTGLRPYVGHHFMTPDIEERVDQVEDWSNGVGEHPWFAQIDYVLVAKSLPMPLLKRVEWTELYTNDELVLLGRAGHAQPD